MDEEKMKTVKFFRMLMKRSKEAEEHHEMLVPLR